MYYYIKIKRLPKPESGVTRLALKKYLRHVFGFLPADWREGRFKVYDSEIHRIMTFIHKRSPAVN